MPTQVDHVPLYGTHLLRSGPVMLRPVSAERLSIGAASIDAGLSTDDLFALWRRPAWHADAACAEHPELTWFPGQTDELEAQKAVCGGCLVRAECLEAGMADPSQAGIWGGLSGYQRVRLTGRRAKPKPADDDALTAQLAAAFRQRKADRASSANAA